MGTHRFCFKICYAETDAGGIVYHANYLRIMEYARMHMLDEINMPSSYFSRLGLLFVVAGINIKYLRPLVLEDLATVETVVKSIESKRIILKQSVKRGSDVTTVADVTLALVEEGRSIEIPGDIAKRFESYKDGRCSS